MQIISWVVTTIFTTALFIHGFLFIPQFIKIWQQKTARGVSLTTFAGFNVVQLSATIHGFLVHDTSLMIGTGFSFCTCVLVTISIVYFNYIAKKQS